MRQELGLCDQRAREVNLEWPGLVAQMVKNLPAVQETQVRSLGWEDPLEEKLAIHSSILAWRVPWTEEPGRLQSMDSQELDMTERLSLSFKIKGKNGYKEWRRLEKHILMSMNLN